MRWFTSWDEIHRQILPSDVHHGCKTTQTPLVPGLFVPVEHGSGGLVRHAERSVVFPWVLDELCEIGRAGECLVGTGENPWSASLSGGTGDIHDRDTGGYNPFVVSRDQASGKYW